MRNRTPPTASMGMARKSSRAVSGTIKVTGVVISLQPRAPEVVHTPLCSRRLQLLPGLDSQKYLEFISAACWYPLRALGNGQQTTQSYLLRCPETLFSSPKMVLGLCHTTDACSITAGIGPPSPASKPCRTITLGDLLNLPHSPPCCTDTRDSALPHWGL